MRRGTYSASYLSMSHVLFLLLLSLNVSADSSNLSDLMDTALTNQRTISSVTAEAEASEAGVQIQNPSGKGVPQTLFGDTTAAVPSGKKVSPSPK